MHTAKNRKDFVLYQDFRDENGEPLHWIVRMGGRLIPKEEWETLDFKGSRPKPPPAPPSAHWIFTECLPHTISYHALIYNYERLRCKLITDEFIKPLEDFIKAHGSFDITTAVALGLGSLCDEACQPTPQLQFLLFMVFVDLLKKHGPSKDMKVYVQDPMFRDIDGAFFHHYGVETLSFDKMADSDQMISGWPATELIPSEFFIFEAPGCNSIPLIRFMLPAQPKLYLGSGFQNILDNYCCGG